MKRNPFHEVLRLASLAQDDGKGMQAQECSAQNDVMGLLLAHAFSNITPVRHPERSEFERMRKRTESKDLAIKGTQCKVETPSVILSGVSLSACESERSRRTSLEG